MSSRLPHTPGEGGRAIGPENQTTAVRVDVSLAQAITEYIEHLKALQSSQGYIKEVGWVLRQYKAAMPSNLPLKLHTTCAG